MVTTFSQKLTDLYYLFDKYNRGLDPIYENNFKEYLVSQSTAEDLVKCIYTFGFEIRDLPLGMYEDHVETLLTLISEQYEKFKEEIESDTKLKTIYNIGLINCYLYFCKQKDTLTPNTLASESGLDVNRINKAYFNIADNTVETSPTLVDQIKSVNQSISYLKKALSLTSSTLDISNGIYTYHLIRIFEYIFSVFEFYKVENNDVPIDLDSFYVFSDQLDENSTLWVELEKQIKSKHNL